jgi:hypothetical protein
VRHTGKVSVPQGERGVDTSTTVPGRVPLWGVGGLDKEKAGREARLLHGARPGRCIAGLETVGEDRWHGDQHRID